MIAFQLYFKKVSHGVAWSKYGAVGDCYLSNPLLDDKGADDFTEQLTGDTLLLVR
jgi:hypothetical protein